MVALGWLIIAATTIASTGALAYCYYKLLKFFIRKHIENYPRIIEEPPVHRIQFPFSDDDDSCEEETNLLQEINNIEMKIHRA